MVNAFRYGFLGVSDVNVPLAFTHHVGATVVLMLPVLWLTDARRGNPGVGRRGKGP